MAINETCLYDVSRDVVESNKKVNEPKSLATGAIEITDVEEGETKESSYSKTSVVFMIIFSGLAIGSDG